MQLCGLTLEEVWGDATLLVLYSDDTVFDSLLVELELWPLESLHYHPQPRPTVPLHRSLVRRQRLRYRLTNIKTTNMCCTHVFGRQVLKIRLDLLRISQVQCICQFMKSGSPQWAT